MSDFEMFILLCSLIFGAVLWVAWCIPFWTDQLYRVQPNRGRWFLLLVPLVCAATIWYVLETWSASDVRNDLGYIILYFVVGLTWIAVVGSVFRYLGVSVTFDVIERRNMAAAAVLAGALIGVTFCYCGSNIGEGPGVEVVILTAGLATFAFFVTWWGFIIFTEVDYTVTIDRDKAAGLRLGGFLIAVGLILGRAAAGNWVSLTQTFIDLVQFGSPVIILLVVAIVIEHIAKPTIDKPAPSAVIYGLVPLLIYIGSAVLYVAVGQFPV